MAAPDGYLPAFPWRRVLPGMAAGAALFFLFLQSLTTMLAWWRGTLAPDAGGLVLDRAAAGVPRRIYPVFLDIPGRMPHLRAAGRPC